MDIETNQLASDITTVQQSELKLLEEIFKRDLQQVNDLHINQGSFLDLRFTKDTSQVSIVDTVEVDHLDKKSHHHNPSYTTIFNRMPLINSHTWTLKNNFNKMKIKHIKNQMFESYNEKNGILNKTIHSYNNFITICQNTNIPSKKPR